MDLSMLAGCIYTATCVGMIIYRIWNVRDNVRDSMEAGSAHPPKTTRLDSIIRIIIDSALGYTIVSLTLFVSLLARSNALYITSDAVSLLWLIMYISTTLIFEVLKEVQAVGIAFNLINIRIADLRNAHLEETSRMSYNGNVAVSPPGVPTAFTAVSRPSYEPSYAFASSQGPEEKSRTIGGDSRSAV